MSMSIDESIQHCEEKICGIMDDIREWESAIKRWDNSRRPNRDSYNQVIDSNIASADETISKCKNCADEHRQLAEWLKELKWWRSKFSDCRTCKFYDKSGFDEPCLSCNFERRSGWECSYKGGLSGYER